MAELKLDETNYSNFSNFFSKSAPIIPREYSTKISRNKILLINLNATITELAKRLILKGFNIYLYDKAKVTESDVSTNFYLTKEDLGQDRLTTVCNKLLHLSAVVSILPINDLSLAKELKIACVGFSNFAELSYYEEMFSRKDIIYYCINASGIYGFYYNNLQIVKNQVKISPVNFSKKVDNLLMKLKNEESFSDKENYLNYAAFLLELYYRKNISKADIKKEMEEEKTSQKAFQKRIFYIENYMKIHRIKSVQKNTEFMNTVKKFIINFNKEFNPICVMMGEIVSKEIFDFIIESNLPKPGITTYNSEKEDFDYASFLSS